MVSYAKSTVARNRHPKAAENEQNSVEAIAAHQQYETLQGTRLTAFHVTYEMRKVDVLCRVHFLQLADLALALAWPSSQPTEGRQMITRQDNHVSPMRINSAWGYLTMLFYDAQQSLSSLRLTSVDVGIAQLSASASLEDSCQS